MIVLGKHRLPNGLIFPAVAGYSDAGARRLALRYGADLCFTEMVSAKGLVYGNENTASLLYTDASETIKGVQLFGRDPDFIARAIAHPALKKFDVIDLNFGCPVPKIVKNGEGSALMLEPETVFRIVSAAVAAAEGRPVTAKLRAGFYVGEHTAPDVAEAVEKAGGAMVTVHGRTREEFYHGKADRGVIAAVKRRVSIPVVANGDVVDRESYRTMLAETGADGVAIARGALGRPYVFAAVRGAEYDFSVKDAVAEHLAVLMRYLPERVAVNNMKKQIAFYVKGQKGGKLCRENAFRATTAQDILDCFSAISS